MDPVSTATLASVVPASARVGNAAPVTPASAAILVNAALANPLVASTQVDISPLGQYLSGVALSRRQLLALQGLDDEAATPANPALAAGDALVALARQLSDSFAQLRASGVDADQLAMPDGSQDDLVQRFAWLSGQVTPGASEALAQNADALTQADLARIGIDLPNNRPVDVATLLAAFEAERAGTLNILQQGTDVLAAVGAALTLRQGVPANIDTTDFNAVAVTQAAQPDQPGQAPALVQQQVSTQQPANTRQQELAQQQALVQRQQEVQQQLETEELTQGLQELRQQQQLQQHSTLQAAQQLQQDQQARRSNPAVQAPQLEGDQHHLQTGRIAREDVETQREAQVQPDAGVVTTAQALQAQQNEQAQQQAALNAFHAVQQPSSQDPAVAAAIAAYNINNSALNPGLMNRPPPASAAQRPAVAPVTRVTGATPLKELKPGV